MKAEICFDIVSEAHGLPKDFSKNKVTTWLKGVALSEHKQLKKILYVFCDDNFLLDINREYLKHETLTDIITFPYSTDPIEAEIYISLERVEENAISYTGGRILEELHRVLVHGLLHMCGYQDDDEQKKQEMRVKESFYLDLL